MHAENRKKLSFGGGLLIYTTVLITLLFVALAFWWHYLSCYETARAERVMDTYMTEALQSDLEAAIETYCQEQATGYQSVNNISTVLTQALGSDDWRYEADEEASTEAAPVFLLYCGNVQVGSTALTMGTDSTLNMGFRSWGSPVSDFDLYQFGKTLTITVPYGCDVYLNGQPLSEDDVVETIGIYPQLAPYEAIIPNNNQLLVYRVNQVFTDVAVEYPNGYAALPMGEDGVYYAVPACDDTLGDQLIDYARNFVQAYVTYTANASSLWTLQQFIVTDSALAKQLTEDSQGLKWGQGVNAEIQTIDIKNFVYYGNAVTCDASYITTRDDGDRSETMKILLVNTDIGWRVAHIELPETEAPTQSPSPTAEAEEAADAGTE